MSGKSTSAKVEWNARKVVEGFVDEVLEDNNFKNCLKKKEQNNLGFDTPRPLHLVKEIAVRDYCGPKLRDKFFKAGRAGDSYFWFLVGEVLRLPTKDFYPLDAAIYWISGKPFLRSANESNRQFAVRLAKYLSPSPSINRTTRKGQWIIKGDATKDNKLSRLFLRRDSESNRQFVRRLEKLFSAPKTPSSEPQLAGQRLFKWAILGLTQERIAEEESIDVRNVRQTFTVLRTLLSKSY